MISFEENDWLKGLLSSQRVDLNRLAEFLHSAQRAKGIVKLLLTRKSVPFDDLDEIRQRAILAFLDESKKDGSTILGRSVEPMDVDGFYRVWWRVVEIVIHEYRREYYRHEHFSDDEHEDAAIQEASLVEACNSVAFEDKIGTQMVFEKFNSIFESTENNKIKEIVNRTTKTPVSCKPKGRPRGSTKEKESMPLVSGIVFKPEVFDCDADSAKKSVRLAAIRKLLGVSISDYAVKIGIPEFRLVSYIYGRVKVIPVDVLQSAERLLNSEKKVVAATIAVDLMSMPEILKVWRSTINGTNEEIVQLFGISNSTMDRWEDGQTRPSIKKIREYNNLIDAAARLLKSQMARR